jgi:hypothetical protein
MAETNTIELSPGTLVGEWRVEQMLGAGRFGSVASVSRRDLNKLWALKVGFHHAHKDNTIILA